jgi:uncharacterized protein (TIGR03435 family)
MRWFLLVLLSCYSAAQPPAAHEFDAASVKKAEPQSAEYVQADPGRIAYHAYPVRKLILDAYNVRDYQVSGPSWIAAERFDIVAKIPERAAKAELPMMLQRLLAARFGLALHHRSMTMQAYELRVGKNGLKNLRPTAGSSRPKIGPGETLIYWPRDERTGIFKLASGLSRNFGLMHTMADLIAIVERRAGLPIVDKTGLTGVYDWDFDSAGAATQAAADSAVPGASDPGPDYLAAFQQQLGLRLEKKKLPIDVLIIDKVDRPSEN